MWDEDPVLDNREYLCIQEIPRLVTLSHTHSLHQWSCPHSQKGVPASPPQHQVEVNQELEQMELDIPGDILDLLDMSDEVMFDFDAWAQHELSYQF